MENSKGRMADPSMGMDLVGVTTKLGAIGPRIYYHGGESRLVPSYIYD